MLFTGTQHFTVTDSLNKWCCLLTSVSHYSAPLRSSSAHCPSLFKKCLCAAFVPLCAVTPLSPPLPLLPLQLLLAKEAKKIAKSCSRVKTRKQPASTGAAAMAATLGEDSHCHLPHLAPQQEARSQQPPPGHLPQLKAVSQLTEQTSQQQAHGGCVTHTCTHTHTHTQLHTHTHTHTHTHASLHTLSHAVQPPP